MGPRALGELEWILAKTRDMRFSFLWKGPVVALLGFWTILQCLTLVSVDHDKHYSFFPLKYPTASNLPECKFPVKIPSCNFHVSNQFDEQQNCSNGKEERDSVVF